MEEGSVVTLADLKRRHWLEVLKACKESGQPVAVWCKENHICKSSYWYWHKKFGDEVAVRAVNEIPEFTELKVQNTVSDANEKLTIERNGIQVKVQNDTSEALLMKVMRCLSNV